MRRLSPAGDPVDLEAAYAVGADLAWHVRTSFISSTDGAVSLDGRAGGLGNASDRAVFGLLRDLSDVILVGAGTARAEGYGAPRPTGERLERRRRHGLPDAPVMALVSGSLGLDPDTALFPSDDGPQTVVYTSSAAPADRRDALSGRADIVECGQDRVDLVAVAADLRARGLRRVHLEGGPRLFGGMLAAGLVDELCLTVAPLLLGGGSDRIVTGPGLPDPSRARLLHTLTDEDYLYLRYSLR